MKYANKITVNIDDTQFVLDAYDKNGEQFMINAYATFEEADKLFTIYATDREQFYSDMENDKFVQQYLQDVKDLVRVDFTISTSRLSCVEREILVKRVEFK
jgi:hypothetical protein